MFAFTIPLYAVQDDNDSLLEALQYLKEQPDGSVLSWWDEGGWIQAYADKPTYLDSVAGQNEHRVELLSKIYAEKNSSKVNEFLEEYDIKYVLVSKDLMWKTYAMGLPQYMEYSFTKDYEAGNFPVKQFDNIHVMMKGDYYQSFMVSENDLIAIQHTYFLGETYEYEGYDMFVGGGVYVYPDTSKLIFINEQLDNTFLTSLLFEKGNGFDVDINYENEGTFLYKVDCSCLRHEV